jgi:hypothetical protein
MSVGILIRPSSLFQTARKLSSRLCHYPALQTTLVCLPVLILLAAGVWFVFPVTDDAWLLLLVKEAGHGTIRPTLANRPLFGALLDMLSHSITLYRVSGLVSSLLIWLLFAIVTARLWNWLHPDEPEFGPAAALLAISPVIVLTQLTTYTVTLPINVGMVLGYLAFFAVANPEPYSEPAFRFRLAVAVLLLAIAAVLSEYAVATAGIGCVLLGCRIRSEGPAWKRYLFGVGALTGGLVLGTLAFRLTADLSSIPQNTFGGGLRLLWDERYDLPFLAVNAVWRSLAGAAIFAFSQVRLSWYEKSTIASALAGVLSASVLYGIVTAARPPFPESDKNRSRQMPWFGYTLALAIGLSPVILRSPSVGSAGPDAHVEEYGTRMYLTAAPIAACIAVDFLRNVLRRRWQWVVIVGIGFVAGHATFRHVWSSYSDRRDVRLLSAVVMPYVEASPGMTLVVLSEYLGRDYQITGQATVDWSPESSRKVWFVWEGRLASLLGHPMDRGALCSGGIEANIRALGVRRAGTFSQVLYVDSTARRLDVEPYCVGTVTGNGTKLLR